MGGVTLIWHGCVITLNGDGWDHPDNGDGWDHPDNGVGWDHPENGDGWDHPDKEDEWEHLVTVGVLIRFTGSQSTSLFSQILYDRLYL